MYNNTHIYDIEDLKYVGEKRAKLYHKLGIYNIKDLIYHCPRSYIDLTNVTNIIDAPLDQAVAIKVVIIYKQQPIIMSKKKLIIYKVYAKDQTSDIVITLFNSVYNFNKLEINNEYILFGKIDKKISGSKWYFEITSPLIENVNCKNKIIPIYPLTEGLTSKIVSRNIYDALQIPGLIEEYLPKSILIEADLIDLNLALHYIHFPGNNQQILSAKKRIVFDELFIFSLSLILMKNNNLKNTSFIMNETNMECFYDILPFKLTDFQFKVIEEIISDMKKDVPMNRLLQGDVGSGKTVVAMAGMYLAYKNNTQSAFMVPTEILARQHFETIDKLMSKLDLNVGLLVGSMTTKQKNLLKNQLMLGNIDVVIGTHAILQDDVVFKNLGFVVTDEQHRFGVKQRDELNKKGNNPHKLIMSATPIPRTLSMIIYGDLDISIIDKVPQNRKPILTYFVNGNKRQNVYNFIKNLLNQGRQAYIVCPVIEQEQDEAKISNIKAVMKYGEDLKNNEFKNYNVAIIHGKTKAIDKDNIMKDFKDKKIDLMISTTVIEVGIDVPNAVVMVIENADRFGFSQLHQLRGRVGRGEYQSYCILISDTSNLESINKLKTLAKTYDGFKIAEYDLKLRGPGDFFGSRQHGLPKFKNSNMITDVEVLKLSQKMAVKVLKDDFYLEKYENKCLKKLVMCITDNISF